MTAPRVLFLCPSAWGLRNVVASGLVRGLCARGLDARVLSTAAADNALAERYAGDGAVPLLAPRPRRGWQRARALSAHVLKASHARRHAIATYDVLDRWHRRAEPWPARLRGRAMRAGAALGARDPWYALQLRAAERLTDRADDLSPVLAQLRALHPALVVASSCVVRDEHPYLRAARTLGVPTLGCVLSFDNVTSKGLLPACDHYAVWSDRMRREVLALRPGAAPARVHVAGSPQFDFHRDPAFRWPRARLLAELGLDPDARYVLWGANAATYTPDEPALVAAVADAFRATPALHAHRLVVRLHPADDPARWTRHDAVADRVVVAPGAREAPLSTGFGQALLVSTLLHADACLNTASTMSLDAAVLDTPVVCVGIGDGAGGARDAAAVALHATTHYAPIVASGGVRLARTIPAVVDEVARYVADPARDRDARARLAADLCGATDGRATERLTELVVALATARAVGLPDVRGTSRAA